MTYEAKTPEQMDAAADLARAELAGIVNRQLNAKADNVTISPNGVMLAADWWQRWYPEAGHKRLGRILLSYASKVQG